MKIVIKQQNLKKYKYSLIVLIALPAIWLLQTLLVSSSSPNITANDYKKEVQGEVVKIQVVHFHATQQCWSCITVGEYAKATITEQFPTEYESGKIEFLEVNGELSENSAIVTKYGAVGSSLFINVITDTGENISEDTDVWRLVTNESKFKEYFSNKLSGLLN